VVAGFAAKGGKGVRPIIIATLCRQSPCACFSCSIIRYSALRVFKVCVVGVILSHPRHGLVLTSAGVQIPNKPNNIDREAMPNLNSQPLTKKYSNQAYDPHKTTRRKHGTVSHPIYH